MKILSNVVVQGPAPYCELEANAGRHSALVWKIRRAGGHPEHTALEFACVELALNFKGIFEGAKMLNDAATAAIGIIRGRWLLGAGGVFFLRHPLFFDSSQLPRINHPFLLHRPIFMQILWLHKQNVVKCMKKYRSYRYSVNVCQIH